MWPKSLGDLEVEPPSSTPGSHAPPSGSQRKKKGPVNNKTYNVSKKAGKLSSHGSLTSVTSMTSVVSEKDNGQDPGSEYNSDHSSSKVSIQHFHKQRPKDIENDSIRKDFDLQPEHKVKWRSFDIIEGVVSFETDYENTLNQMECESKQKRQRKVKKRTQRNRLRKKFTYTFLRPKHYTPLVDDPDAIEEIRAIEEEFERRRQEYAPLLQFNNKKFWKKLSNNSDPENGVQNLAESLSKMKVASKRKPQPTRLKATGRLRTIV